MCWILILKYSSSVHCTIRHNKNVSRRSRHKYPFVTGLMIKNKTLSPHDRLLNVTTGLCCIKSQPNENTPKIIFQRAMLHIPIIVVKMDPKESCLFYNILPYLLPYHLYSGLSQPLPTTFIKYKLKQHNRQNCLIYQFNHTWKHILIHKANR